MIGIIVYRLSVFIVFSATLPKNPNGTDPIQKYLTPQMATSITASIISFIIIMILNTIYEKVAIMITNFGEVLPGRPLSCFSFLWVKMGRNGWVRAYRSIPYGQLAMCIFVFEDGSTVQAL